jgi:hypothetical protein
MPKWKKDATEFNTKVSYHEHRGYQCYVPRPIMEKLGNHTSIKFVIKDNRIELNTNDDLL